MIVKTEKTEIILRHLHEVNDWFLKNKINTNATRFKTILEIVERITETSLNDYIKDKGFECYFQAAIGAISFIDLFRGFSSYKGSLPKKKFIESLSGPLIPNDEILGDANVNPRNTFFELEIASKMIRSGLKVTGFDDINLKYKKYKFFIECKRLLSKSNIKHNIENAYMQLSKKLLNKNDRGIIALSFDRSYEIYDKILDTSSYNLINYNFNKIGDIFIRDNAHIWNAFLNLKVIGIILYIQFGSVYQDSKILYSNQMCFISLRSDLQISDADLFFRFKNKIEKNCNR